MNKTLYILIIFTFILTSPIKTANAELFAASGKFNASTSTGNQSITDPGFEPKVVFFWSNRSKGASVGSNFIFGMGAAVSSTSRFYVAAVSDDGEATSNTASIHVNDAAIYAVTAAQELSEEADFVSMDANGFTLNWTTANNAIYIPYFALGGDDITNVAIKEFSAPTSDGTSAVTGVGFQPDLVVLMSSVTSSVTETFSPHARLSFGLATTAEQNVAAVFMEDGTSTSNTSSFHYDDAVFLEGQVNETEGTTATLTSMDADGFSLNWANTSSAYKMYAVCIKGGSYKIGVETANTVTDTKSYSGIPFHPKGLLMLGVGVTGTSTSSARWSLGTTSGNNHVSTSADYDNQDTTDSYRLYQSNRVQCFYQSGTCASAGVYDSLDHNGFTIDWVAAIGNAYKFSSLAVGNTPITSVTEFESTINQPGEDYNTITLWEDAMDEAGDLTASDVLVFSHGGIDGTIDDGENVIGATSSATGVAIHATSSQILIDQVSGSFRSSEDVVAVDSSGTVTLSNAGDTPILTAVLYSADGTLTENVTIDGLTTSATNYIKITTALTSRHAGTAGSGFVHDPSGDGHAYTISDDNVHVEWVDITGWSGASSEAFRVENTGFVLSNSLIHNSDGDANSDGVYIGANGIELTINNCIFYSIARSGIHVQNYQNVTVNVNNSTFWRMKVNASQNEYPGIGFDETKTNTGSVFVLKNVFVHANQDEAIHGGVGGGAFTGSDYVATDDGTANTEVGAATNQTNLTDSDEFENVAGPIDLHLKSGSNLIDAGTDLGTTAKDDIDGRDRNANNDVWDIGADEREGGAVESNRRINVTQLD